MTKAEDMVAGTDISVKFAEAIADVSSTCKQGFAYLDDDNIPEADKEELRQKLENHGLHAYRYEEMDDGSAIAFYANDESGEVKFKTFENMQEASLWSPRDERPKAEVTVEEDGA